MKIPFSWLKDYVELGNTRPEEVAERLTIAGLEVVLIEKIGSDSIFDIEITPNRPDCFNMVGIAREVSAACGKRFKPPKIKKIKPTFKAKPTVQIKDKALCPRYTARIIKDVKVGPSPKWLVETLEKMGLRSVNNVVDVTNYCLFELGQPTHAFDYDKLKGKIIARRASKGEKMLMIDGRERALSPEMLVISDEEKAIALGGVMGSKDTEVTNATTNILFESAYFNPVSVRRTSRGLGLISESSYRFERSVDMGMVPLASDKACSMIMDLCGGKAGPIEDKGKATPKEKKIPLRTDRVEKVLGLKIPTSAIKRILSSLRLGVKLMGKSKMIVNVPSFRQDLAGEIDLIEEVVRIYGYDRLPLTMPKVVGHSERIGHTREVSDIVRNALVSLGVDEVITYSLISKKDLEDVTSFDDKKIVVVKNPLSIEQEIMRPSIIPGILGAASWNLNRGMKAFSIFEVGRIYLKESRELKEKETLTMAFIGKGGFFDLKGALETLFERLGIAEVSFDTGPLPDYLTGQGASVKFGSKIIGALGKIDKKVLDRCDISSSVVLCEISLQDLLEAARLKKRFHAIPKFPSAKRDISIIVKRGTPYSKVVKVIKEAGGEMVKGLELFDQYVGVQIPQGHKGLSFSVEYRSDDRTLTDMDISTLHAKVSGALLEKLGAKIR